MPISLTVGPGKLLRSCFGSVSRLMSPVAPGWMLGMFVRCLFTWLREAEPGW